MMHYLHLFQNKAGQFITVILRVYILLQPGQGLMLFKRPCCKLAVPTVYFTKYTKIMRNKNVNNIIIYKQNTK